MQEISKRTFLRLPLSDYIGLAIYLAMTVWYLFFYYGFVECQATATGWLVSAWNPETDYEHGWMVPLLAVYLLSQAVKELKNTPTYPSIHGLWLTAIGGLLCLLAARTQQGRVAIGALPFLLSGAVWYYWGGKAALKTAFPLFFLWLAIPAPGFQQATVGLQMLAAKMAHYGATLCGVDTILDGTNVISAQGKWDSYNIAGGCSGIRSLMALFMFSVAWAYLADKLALWKRLLLGLSALPLAVLANAFRVASIFVCAEYVSPSFAGKTWHDWSGLIFFFPASLAGLVILHGLLSGEIPFLKKRRTITRRHGEPATEKGEPSA